MSDVKWDFHESCPFECDDDFDYGDDFNDWIEASKLAVGQDILFKKTFLNKTLALVSLPTF